MSKHLSHPELKVLVGEIVGTIKEYSPIYTRRILSEISAPFIPETSSMLSSEKIKEIFLRCGFTIKEGQDDLKTYVYDAAHQLAVEVQRLTAAMSEDDRQTWENMYQTGLDTSGASAEIDWGQGDLIGDWRSRVNQELRDEWKHMPEGARRGVIRMAEDLRKPTH